MTQKIWVKRIALSSLPETFVEKIRKYIRTLDNAANDGHYNRQD
jgi:hypothetical protein